jgi:hypothetical protein
VQTGVPAWHTPEEMQAFSNAAHVAEGTIIAAVALLVLAEQVRASQRPFRLFSWPTLVLFAGVFLLGYLLIPWHGPSMATAQWSFIFSDPQQRQHVWIALALVASGLLEIVSRRTGVASLRYGFPVGLALIGAAFLSHAQHGTSAAVQRAVIIHRLLGASLLAAAALALAARSGSRAKWLHYAWPLMLIITALLLFLYREPAGAYKSVTDHVRMQGM